MDIIRNSAGNWAKRVGKALTQLASLAARHCSDENVCRVPDCDHGIILTRRYDMKFPCAHVVTQVPDIVSLTPEQFDLGEIGEPNSIVKEGLDAEQRSWPVPMPAHHGMSGKITEPAVREPNCTEEDVPYSI